MQIQLRKSAEQWILDRSTLRRVQERTGISFVGKWKQVQRYAKYIPTPLKHLEQNISEATGILIMDGKFDKVKGKNICTHIAYDTGVGVIDYWIDETENKTAYWYMLRRLEEIGYKPIICVSDGHSAITSVLEDKNIPNQRCIFHLIKEMRACLIRRTQNNEIPKPYKVLYSRIKWILKTKKIGDLPQKIEQFRKVIPCFHTSKQKELIKWFWKVLPNAVLHLSYNENIPRTSNLLENLNGQIEQRVKTFRGIKSEDSFRKILKILFYFRNYK